MTSGTVMARKRDAAATQRSLLVAATELFGARGYEGTTLRDIADLAGADAALIARYFGSKAALYVAVLGAEAIQYQGSTLEESVGEMVALQLARTDASGVGPITQALLSPETSLEVRMAAADRVQRRLISRLVAQMPDGPDGRKQLQAEIATAALMGVLFMRSHGTFDRLTNATGDELEALVAEMILATLQRPDMTVG